MLKLSSRWWTSIVISFVVLMSCPPDILGASPQEVAQGRSNGETEAQTVREKYGSKSGLREFVFNPMVSSGTDMQTVDGQSSFTAQLSHPSSKKFLDVFVQSGTTGDLATVIVGEDLDFDGTTDYTYQLPMLVSGVCANGIISCTPGTWENCLHYGWTADVSGRVTLDDAFPDNLGGCYCINTGCGNNLVWNNSQIILKDLGGGIVGAVQKRNSSFTITDVKTQPTTITYYGQDTSREHASSGTYSAGPPPETAFLNNPMAITGSVNSLVGTQASDPNSLYSLISNLDTQQQQNTCAVTKQILLSKPNINDVIVPLGGTGAVQYCGPDCINVVLGRIGDNYWRGHCAIYQEDFDVLVKRPDLIQSATIVRAKWDDYMQVWIDNYKVWSGPNNNFPPETGGRCELSTSWNQNPGTNVTSYFKRPGVIKTKIRVSVTGGGEGYAFVRIRLYPNRCISSSSIADGCASLDRRSDCRLQEEKVDGVRTFMNANPTNLTPLPSTRTLSQGNCTEQVERDWWQKERIYLCESPAYDFSDAATRYGKVVNSVADGSTTYDDQIRVNGEWKNLSGSMTLPEAGDFAECEQACKTRRPREDTQATLTGTSNKYQVDTRSWDFLYHTCVDDVCPTETGEEILKDCQCLNEFTEAVTIMQMLRKAGEDTICSDGVAK